jgi:3-oxosteroid 1-dehydrogenase
MTGSEQEYWWIKGVFGQPAPRPEGFAAGDADEFDVVVVGSGMAGFATAVLAHDEGLSVLMLEAAPDVGGTTYKSGAGMWIPNNSLMRSLGIFDDRDECLSFMARIAHPRDFDPDAERYGMGEWEWEKLTAFYDNASAAIDALGAAGALQITTFPSFTERYPAMISYHSQHDMSMRGFYRHLMPLQPNGVQGIGWEMIRQLSEAAKERGIELRTEHRVRGLVHDDAGAVVGVTADTPSGTVSLYARRGVVFATGGFPHNLELIDEHWRGPLYSSCAVPTAQGDFVGIGLEAGAELGNMRNGWLYEDLLEKAAPNRVAMEGGINVPPGDSMIYVSSAGKRVVNEKSIYQNRAQVFWERDEQGDYPNRVLFMVYDDFVATDTRPWLFLDTFQRPKPWMIEGATLEELAGNVQERLAALEPLIGPMSLAPDFAQQLGATIERFNGFARDGIDEDFHRCETVTEYDWNGPAREGNDNNPGMYPFSDEGPYFCTLICGMVLDTNGGPKTNATSEVLRADGSVIEGLYGAGNCVAAVAGDGYLSGGSTLGPAATFAYLAAKSVAQEAPRDLSAVRATAAA